jgi:hypothetical protein
MAHRRAWFGAAVVGLGLAGTAGVGWEHPAAQAGVVFVGHVRVTSAPDRCDTVVSVARRDDSAADADVRHAFLLQTDEPLGLELAGPALVVFDRTTLVLSFASGDLWTFVVRGQRPEAGLATPDRWVSVMGLAHSWGRAVEGLSHDDLVARLATGRCDAAERSDPACQHCESGGPGSERCEAATCSVVCGDGAYACCSDTDGCRCCRNSLQRPSPLARPGASRPCATGACAESAPARLARREPH